MVGRGWLRMLWSRLQPTLSLQTATVGLGPSPNCTAPGHCSTKGIESLHNVTRQKCEWVRGAWPGLGGMGLARCRWGWGAVCGMERCWAWGWSHDVRQGWELLGWGPGVGLSWRGRFVSGAVLAPEPHSAVLWGR